MTTLFQGSEPMYAFVSGTDQHRIKSECVDRAWIAGVWQELRRKRFRTPRGRKTGQNILLAFTQGACFADAFANSDAASRSALGAVSRWFTMRCIGGQDGTASLPALSLYDTNWPGGAQEAAGLRGQWLALELNASDNEADGCQTTLPASLSDPAASAPARMVTARRLDNPEQAVLQALHFPAPDGNDVVDLHDGKPIADFVAKLYQRGLAAAHGARDWLTEAIAPPPQWVPAGAPAGWRPPPSAHAYVNSPRSPAIGGLAQPGRPNPMVAVGAGMPPPQPFVGILDVGQGNCNVIVDGNWHVQAYFDFGLSKSGDIPDQLVDLCFCHRPPIIISHWDHDHYMLHTRVRDSLLCTWITPRQGTGTVASSLGGKVKRAGGRVYVWARPAPSFMAFPWGYVERCSGDPRDYNASGLAAWVCVRDRPLNPVTPGTDAWNVAGPVNSLTDDGTSEVQNRARNSVAHAHVTGLPAGRRRQLGRCLAGVLGNSRFGATLGENNCALSARNVANAVHAAITANATRPAPLNITTAVNAGNDYNGIPVAQQPRAIALTAAAAVGALLAPHVGYSTAVNAASCPFGTTNSVPLAANDITNAANTAGFAPLPANVAVASAAVAGALKASRYGRYLTQAQAAGAAVRAVRQIDHDLGGGLAALVPEPPAIRDAALDNNAMDALPDSVARRRRAAGEMTVAAVVGYFALEFGLPEEIAAQCAAGGFLQERAQVWPQPAVGALMLPPAVGGVPQVRAGAALFVPEERYVLLTGDANFNNIPSCNVTPMPKVVGLVAMHHGSFLEGNVYLHGATIPWAPGSPGSQCAEYVRDACAAGPRRMIELACDAAHGVATPATTTAAHHVAAAAAAAIYLANMTYPGDMLFNALTADQAAASAAAAAFAVYLIETNVVHGDARLIGIAAALPLTMTKLNPISTPPGKLALAADAIRVHGAAVTSQQVTIATRGIVGSVEYDNYAAHVAAAAAIVDAHPAAVTPVNARNAARRVARRALRPLQVPHQLAYSRIAGLIARGVTAGVQAVAGVGNEATAARVAGHILDVTAALNQRDNTIFAAQPNLAHTAAKAARWAGEAVAAHLANVPLDQLWAVMAAVDTGTIVNAAAGHNDNPSARIAYSYGVRNTGKHAYRSPNLGGYGHPHPPALAFYEARGWTERRNATRRANAGVLHAGHIDQDDALNPSGHVALCWNAQTDLRVAAGGQINYACPTCGNAIDLNI